MTDDVGDKEYSGSDETIIGELSIAESRQSGGGLLASSAESGDKGQYTEALKKTLQEVEQDLKDLGTITAIDVDQTASWKTARGVVEGFRPVPWFIWRLSNFVFGRPGTVPVISEGMVFGMRRLLFAAASDDVLGGGEKVSSVRKALEILSADVVGAVSVIHAICRRLHSCQFERIWHPILEDALIRAQIGLFLGQVEPSFGAGRGMLAGFSGRSGLAVLIATGTIDQAREALELLAQGVELRDVGSRLYRCNPLQVSAMLLSASGCGRDSAFGTVAYASTNPAEVIKTREQEHWLAAYTVAEQVRASRLSDVSDRNWDLLGFHSDQEKEDLEALVRMLVRRGSNWGWIAQ